MIGQCPTQDVYLKTQAEVDQFIIDFPNCTQLSTLLWIGKNSNNDIDNLEALSNLEEINGRLVLEEVYDNSGGSLLGLRNLKSVDFLDVKNLNVGQIDEQVNFLVQSNLRITRGQNLETLGGIKVNSVMDRISFSQTNNLEPDAYNILKDVDTSKEFTMLHASIPSLGSEFPIHVDSIFRIEACDLLSTFSGITIKDTMHIVTVDGFRNTEETIVTFENMVECSEFEFGGGYEFSKDLPSIPLLNKVDKLSLKNLPELTDLSRVSNIVINEEIQLTDLEIFSLEGINLNTEENNDFIIKLTGLSNIQNLEGLEKLEYARILEFLFCPSLSSLQGLESLKEVSYLLRFDICQLLSDLTALQNLKEVGILDIENSGLNNLRGLESLEHMTIGLKLEDNFFLQNLAGLQNLKTIGFNPPDFDFLGVDHNLYINGNESLSSIAEISNIDAFIEELEITNNPNLTNCSIAPICKVLANDDVEKTIEDNKEGCNDIIELSESCRDNHVLVFFDENKNGNRDENEIGLPIGKINVNNEYEVLANHSNGIFSFFDAGDNAFIEYIADENWEITAESNIYELNSNEVNNIEIGICPSSEIHDIDVSLAFDRLICDQEYSLIATLRNTGTVIKTVSLEVNGHGNLISDFSTFQVVDLIPGEVRKFQVYYKADGVDETTPGDLVSLEAIFTYENELGKIVSDSKIYHSVFLCAFDPNDKTVFPPGVEDDNYTLFDDNSLEYKIRFQNTGNFPAEDIVIIDTLSEHLNLNTFQYLHSSHPITEVKQRGNVVAFTFEDVFLVDSLSNEPESHGYVQFSIETLDDLSEGTVIENTGHIYFDSNPSIVTNTVLNTFVSEIPGVSATIISQEPKFDILPIPAYEYLIINSHDYKKGDYIIYNELGKVVLQGSTQLKNFGIDIENLGSGLYFLRLNNQVKRFVKIE